MDGGSIPPSSTKSTLIRFGVSKSGRFAIFRYRVLFLYNHSCGYGVAACLASSQVTVATLTNRESTRPRLSPTEVVDRRRR